MAQHKLQLSSSPLNETDVQDLETSYDNLFFKFILIGDAGAGKTALLQRYIENKFNKDYHVTVGGEFASKFVNIDESTRIKLQIWDITGQESFSTIVRTFYKDSQGVFLVYNIAKRQSFENLLKWKENVCEEVDPSVIFVLIGSQTDRDDQRQEKYLLILVTCNRQVTYEEGVEFMQENGMHFFFETSALNGTNIDLAFLEATKLGFISYLKDKKAGEGSIFHPKNDNAIYLSQKNDQNEQSKCAC